MTLSARGLQLIKNFEGFRADAYRDAAGVWTVGFGTTRGAVPGKKVTVEEAERLLREDVTRFEQAVNEAVAVPLTQEQFDALVSFTYNVGAWAFRGSTLLRKLNEGAYDGAQREFGRWVNAKGRRLEGLVRRRKAEAELFGSTPQKPLLTVRGVPVQAHLNEQGEVWVHLRALAGVLGLRVEWDATTKTAVVE